MQTGGRRPPAGKHQGEDAEEGKVEPPKGPSDLREAQCRPAVGTCAKQSGTPAAARRRPGALPVHRKGTPQSAGLGAWVGRTRCVAFHGAPAQRPLAKSAAAALAHLPQIPVLIEALNHDGVNCRTASSTRDRLHRPEQAAAVPAAAAIVTLMLHQIHVRPARFQPLKRAIRYRRM